MQTRSANALVAALFLAGIGGLLGLIEPPPAAVAAGPSELWSAGYWTPQAGKPIPASEIEWKALTHIIYWAAMVKPDGSLDLQTQQLSDYAPSLIESARAAHVKVLLGVSQPYWRGEKSNLRQASTHELDKLTQNIAGVVEQYGFDGADLDWEPFESALDAQASHNLIKSLRVRLGKKLLTAAAVVTESASWGPVTRDLDQLHVMTYDLTGSWTHLVNHNSALFGSGPGWSAEMAVKKFRAAGADPAKISIGIPFFGYRITGSAITKPGQVWTGKAQWKQIYYQQLARLILPSVRMWDDKAAVPYFSLEPDEFYTYDDAQSIAAKIKYVKENGLGGWFVWEVGGDYLPAQNPSQPLLSTITKLRTGDGK